MPRVEMFNLYYFIYLGITALVTIILIFYLKNKSDDYKKWFLFGLLVVNFAIHFLKIFIYPYTTVDFRITKVSPENICAVSVLLFPFLYFTKNQSLKDYMVMAGMASGLLALFYPVDLIVETFNGEYFGPKHAFAIESIRFYITHILIFVVPFLMMYFKLHKVSIKRVWHAPILLFFVLIIIFINELLITLFGWVPKEDLFNPMKRNPSFIFGARSDLQGLGVFLGLLVPAFMMRFDPVSGITYYLPVVWLILPVFIYGNLISLMFMFIYDRENTLNVIKKVFSYKWLKKA